MTVIKRNQPEYKFAAASASASDNESLNLGSASASDIESANEPESSQPTRFANIYRPFSFSRHLDNAVLKKHSGKRKTRRYQNCCILQTLCEEEDEDSMALVVKPYKTPFERLIEDKEAMKCWNEFINKSEEEQNKIIESLTTKHKCGNCNDETKLDIDNPFAKISSKIKRTLKIRKNLSLEMVKSCETDMIHFFITSPKDTYIKFPPTSFERLLLHAIAQFHSLDSFSQWINELRGVEVLNSKEEWCPAEGHLYECISQMRH